MIPLWKCTNICPHPFETSMLLVLASSNTLTTTTRTRTNEAEEECPSIDAILFSFCRSNAPPLFLLVPLATSNTTDSNHILSHLHLCDTQHTNHGQTNSSLQLMGVHRRIWWPGQCWSFSKGVIYFWYCSTHSSYFPHTVGTSYVCATHSAPLSRLLSLAPAHTHILVSLPQVC